jgi:hypothetical protein
MSSSARKLNLYRKSMTAITITLVLISSAVTLSSFLGASALRESFPEDFKRIAHDVEVQPSPERKAPIATSGDNIYIAWWTNKTGNDEVMFRASTDNGQTFRDKINLSNSTKSDSQDAHIDASGDKVFVTWWERNATSEEPLLRTSTDMGATFSPIMKLSNNGTIGGSGG